MKEADESLDFEEQILEAAKAIANATSALVKAASHAQRELVQQGKVRLRGTSLSSRAVGQSNSYLTGYPLNEINR